MSKFAIVLIILALASHLSGISQTNYYWRDYTGKIPDDAITGGKDINGKNIYIGQAFVKTEETTGLIVVQINPDVKYVYAELYGENRIENFIKILCGRGENFEWFPSNYRRLHVDLLNKSPVIGGHEGNGTINIGRIFYEGSTQIGKIVSYQIGNALFYCVDRNNKAHYTVQSYEVLVDKQE